MRQVVVISNLTKNILHFTKSISQKNISHFTIMIVISNPVAVANEISLIHSLFEEGLALFHVRKPEFTEIEMMQFIQQIKPEFRSKLVLHTQHQIADAFGISKIHFSERERNQTLLFPFENKTVSTSSHTIADFNALEPCFEYAFLSPVFKSISKENYASEIDLFEAVKSRKNFRTKMIALGGISPENSKTTLENGFDGIALLGAIWNHENPVNQFILCQKIVLTYSL